MSCQDFRLLISEELDGALDPREAQALAGHLDRCASCRAFQAEQKQLDRLIHAAVAKDHPPPARIWQSIAARIEEKEVAQAAPAPRARPFGQRIRQLWPLPRFDLRWGYAAAALALLILVSLAFLNLQVPGDMERRLAELDSISGPELRENPYREEITAENPYLAHKEPKPRNPFSGS